MKIAHVASLWLETKIYQCHVIKMTLLHPMEKCPIDFYHKVAFTALPPEAEYSMEPFRWCLPAVQIWCFELLHAWRYINFQTGHFGDFEQCKVDIHFANFEQVKIDPICSFLLTLNRLQLFCRVWARHATINNPNPLLLTKKSRTRHRIWHKPFSIIQSINYSIQIKNWFPQSINRLQRFSLLFLSVTHFLIFAKSKICMIRIKRKGLGIYLLNGYFFLLYCQELHLEPNQKSSGDFLQK